MSGEKRKNSAKKKKAIGRKSALTLDSRTKVKIIEKGY